MTQAHGSYDHSKPDDKAEFYIIDRTGKKHKPVVPFPMTQDAANRISTVLSLYFMKAQTQQENADWVNQEKGEPFKVKWVPSKREPVRKATAKPKPKGDDLHGWNRVIQAMADKK